MVDKHVIPTEIIGLPWLIGSRSDIHRAPSNSTRWGAFSSLPIADRRLLPHELFPNLSCHHGYQCKYIRDRNLDNVPGSIMHNRSLEAILPEWLPLSFGLYYFQNFKLDCDWQAEHAISVIWPDYLSSQVGAHIILLEVRCFDDVVIDDIPYHTIHRQALCAFLASRLAVAVTHHVRVLDRGKTLAEWKLSQLSLCNFPDIYHAQDVEAMCHLTEPISTEIVPSRCFALECGLVSIYPQYTALN